MRRGAGGTVVMLGAVFGLALVAAPAAGQGFRGWATTTFRYLEMQPLQLDTARAGDVVYDSDGNARVDGQLIWCTETPCAYYRPAPVRDALLGSQDVGLTVWGLGVTGLSFTAMMRARDHLSGDLEWPLASDRFDLMVAYAELRTGPVRLRAGRQDTPSGLGFSAFDGGSAFFERGEVWAEGFGGRSLARGLSETRREALRGIEDFVLDQEAYLLGGAVGYRRGASGVSVRYQREIHADRIGLVSERGALDLQGLLPGAVRLRGSADYDFGFGRLGKANLTLQRGLFQGRVLAEVEARRYVPYFELSTIWGFFDPVPYHELRLRASGGTSRGTGFRVALAAREYDDPATAALFRPMEDRGYRVEVGGLWSPTPSVRIDAGYDLDWGAAAFLHSFDGTVSVDWTTALRTRLTMMTFQQFEAFRLGDGRALGGALGVDWAVSERVRLDGILSLVRQEAGRDGPGDSWNQLRGSLGMRYEFGEDPGLRRRRR